MNMLDRIISQIERDKKRTEQEIKFQERQKAYKSKEKER